MKAGIIGAMEQEVTLLRDKMINRQMQVLAGYEICTGMLNGVSVALLRSGIGKVSAALSTTLLLQLCDPDLIINIGSAGSLISNLKVGDIVISDEVCYHDVDVTAFGYENGQMAGGCPVAFKANCHLIDIAERCIKSLNFNVVCGLVVSGDTFINGTDSLARIHNAFPQAIAVEMEAAAIGHVCHQFGTPFVMVRSISDMADEKSHFSFDKFLAITAQKYSLIVETLLTQLVPNPRPLS